ncbi:DUF3040 domain-containing protein [Corynebacterium vitaeruminis]|uniref:DUF3040 domain-containing protein n=1 Tax=Corynebacterium vitaeruminis TaxID=38305 RepID=UPI00054DE939|nr:DUF3040 domain-containing protein [Corynebacterium vitaeruminis]
MALSEQEQRALREIEQSLMADDPTFGASVTDAGFGQGGSLSIRGIAVIVIGLVMLVGGVALSQHSLWFVTLSILGFIVMLAGGVWMLKGKRGPGGGFGSPKKKSAPKPSGRFSGRMEDNFRRRFES